MASALEPELDRELDDPRVVGSRDEPEVGRRERRDGVLQLRVVEQVEDLGAELELPFLARLERPREAHVHVERARAAQ